MHVHLELDLPADAKLLPRTRWALLGYLDTAAKRDAQRREVELRAELAQQRDKPRES